MHKEPHRRPALLSGRALLGAVFSLALVVALLGGTRAQAQTMLTASDGASLVSAITPIGDNPGTSYTLNITGNITLSSTTTLPAITTTSSVTINGGNVTLDSGSVQRGLFVYAGPVAER